MQHYNLLSDNQLLIRNERKYNKRSTSQADRKDQTKYFCELQEMSQEINFCDLNEVQKEQYIKYIIENNIPLHEDSSKREIVAEIKLQTSQKKIIQKYTTLDSSKNIDQSPIRNKANSRDYQSIVHQNSKSQKQNDLYSSTPNQPKHLQHENKENEAKGRQTSKSPTPNQRTASPFQQQILTKNQIPMNLPSRKLFVEDSKSNKTPLKQRLSNVPSSILKEVNYNIKEGTAFSENKDSKNTIPQRPFKENMETKQRENNNDLYIPTTQRKKSIKEEPQINKPVKRSVSPIQQKQRSTSQYQILSANGAFGSQAKNQSNLNSNPTKQQTTLRDASKSKRRFTLETSQEPFNLTISTIKSKETTTHNFNTECSLFNKTSKSGNILVVDNSGIDNHSQSTSSSNSSSYQCQGNSSALLSSMKQLEKPHGKNKMNEIYDILKSVGFCPSNNTPGSEYQSMRGGMMRSDPQELSVKLDTKNLFFDSILGDDANGLFKRKSTPSPQAKSQQQQGFQSEYLRILNEQQNLLQNEDKKSPQNKNHTSSAAANGFSRGRASSINEKASPMRKKSISSFNNQAGYQSVSPNQQLQRDKSCGNYQDGYQSNKEFKIHSSIANLFKHKFNRLSKIPIAHMCGQIEELFIARDLQNQKGNGKKGVSFKAFVYDFYLKKYKNNQKTAEASLFNLIGSIEFHSEFSDSTIAKQFLLMVEEEYTEEQVSYYLAAFCEIQLNFKQKSLQLVHLSEKTVFKISLKLFSSSSEQPLCYEIIEKVSKHEQFQKSQTIGAYSYLQILMEVVIEQTSIENAHLKQKNGNNKNGGQERKRRNSQNSHSPPIQQKPFSMVNESFGIQSDFNNALSTNRNNNSLEEQNKRPMTQSNSKEYIEGTNNKNPIKSILSNKDYQSETLSQNIAKQTDFFFSNQYEDIKSSNHFGLNSWQSLCSGKNIISQSCPTNITQIQQIQSALFAEMEKIVIEFVQMFEIGNKQSAKKLSDMIQKKCKYLIMSLILKEQSKWFSLLLIDYPNYQQKMQAETIQKLYEAYERSFIQNNKSTIESKNLRSLCKLILKVPELNDAISKLLICVLVPES